MAERLIVANGEVVSDNEYVLKVSGLPSHEHARKFAQEMAAHIVQALDKVMGKPPRAVGTNGDNMSEESLKALSDAAGGQIDIGNLKSFLEKAGAPPEVADEIANLLDNDNCQCPGCIARRAHESKIDAGSKSDAKH